MEKYGYRFSFGPWNIHTGADLVGPPVHAARDYEQLDRLILGHLMGRA